MTRPCHAPEHSWNTLRALGAVLLAGCATAPAAMPTAEARPFTQLGPWPYRVGPITVLVLEREADVELLCRRATRTANARGCYFTHAGREYIVSTPEWDVVIHEFRHALEGPWHQ